MWAFLSLVGHYRRFIRGFTCITQPLGEYLTREGASRKLERVSLTKNAMEAFKALKQACMTAPVLVFADYTKPFLLETNASKDWLGTVLLQKSEDRWYHPIAHGSRALTPQEKNYYSTKLEFLALKWAVIEHFKEYLPYQSFVVWTDNNLLMYIMSTPNLDATGYQWVGSLAWLNFKLEYQKGHDNMVADVLSQVTNKIEPENSEIHPQWSHCRNGTSCQSPWPGHGGRWPALGTRRICCCRPPIGGDACYQLGQSPEKRPNVECSVGTGWKHRSRQIWRCFWQNMPPVKKTDWSYGINRILQFIRETCTYT